MIAFACKGSELFDYDPRYGYAAAGLIKLTASGSFEPGPKLMARLAREDLPGNRVVILCHGWQFDPFGPAKKDPHLEVFAAAHAARNIGRGVSWREFTEPGGYSPSHTIGFGWRADASFWQANTEGYQHDYQYVMDRLAPKTARCLVALLLALGRLGAGPVGIVAHSMGTRVVLQALAMLPPDAAVPFGTILLLGGSEYVPEARQGALAAPGATFVNLASRGDWVLDTFAEDYGTRRFGPKAQVIGHNGIGGIGGLPNWTDLQLDRGELLRWGRDNGYALHPVGPNGSDWHWGYYTHLGNHKLYADILSGRRPIAQLAAAGLPLGVVHPFVD